MLKNLDESGVPLWFRNSPNIVQTPWGHSSSPKVQTSYTSCPLSRSIYLFILYASYIHLMYILYTSYIHLEVSRSYMKLFPYRRGFNMIQHDSTIRGGFPRWFAPQNFSHLHGHHLKRQLCHQTLLWNAQSGLPAEKFREKKWWMNVGFGLVDWFKNPSKNPQQKIMKRYSERPEKHSECATCA